MINTKPILKIEGDTVGLVLRHCTFDTLEIKESNTSEIGITGCDMTKLSLWQNKVKESLWIHNSRIGVLETSQNEGSNLDLVKVKNQYLRMYDDHMLWMNLLESEFCSPLAQNLIRDSLIITPSGLRKFQLIKDSSTLYRNVSNNEAFHLQNRNSNQIRIRSCSFDTYEFSTKCRFTIDDCLVLIMNKNKFQSSLQMEGSIADYLGMDENEFQNGVVLIALSFPETPAKRVSLSWQDFKGKLWVFFGPYWAPYYGETDQELPSVSQFNHLIQSYYKLYNAFRTQGEIDNANDCYITLKELHERRLSYLWRTEGGFTNFFRFKLSQLLGIYTRHGTDPAQAIVGSIWVVLFFAVFYFFYPSEWDKETKKEMIARFRLFMQKNEHGYIRPFFHLLGGLSISMINALTLSLNVFVTLGFGSIPTSGLARYVCIIQGFIGWFLLSIFTVSLINQVLF